MEFKILTKEEKILFKADIINMLVESDDEFLPPLSKRTSPRDKTFSHDNVSSDGILSYFNAMIEQEIMVSLDGDRLVGFVSYYENYESGQKPNIYVSTLIVAKAARGLGITSTMYSYLFDKLYSDRYVYTRTWSTNIAHTKILSRFGFSEFNRIKDERGIGIDTVYFVRPIKSCKEN